MVDFTIKNLEIFIEVVEHSSFCMAAEKLFLSQSTVSAAIHALEKSFGVQLLERNARKKVELTNDGEILYPLAKRIVEQCNEAQKAFHGGPMHPIMIGATTAMMQKMIPELVNDYSKQNPDCRYVFECGTSDQIHDMLREKTIRVGFVVQKQGASIFSYIPVSKDKYVIATAATDKYRMLKEQGATAEQLLMEPMVAGVDRILIKFIRYFGIPYDRLNIVARAKSSDAVKALVIQNVGVSVASMMSIQREVDEGRMLEFDMKRPGMEREISMVYRNDIKLTPYEQQFISFIEKRNRMLRL